MPISFEQKYLIPLEERIRMSKSAAGAWKDEIDGDSLIRQIHADRRRGLPPFENK